MRSAAVAGARYGLSCLGCSAALMVAMVLLGMSSLWWAVILGIVVLIYKFAPPLRMRYELVLSAALVALGVAYVMMAWDGRAASSPLHQRARAPRGAPPR